MVWRGTRVQRAATWRGFSRAVAVATKQATPEDCVRNGCGYSLPSLLPFVALLSCPVRRFRHRFRQALGASAAAKTTWFLNGQPADDGSLSVCGKGPLTTGALHFRLNDKWQCDVFRSCSDLDLFFARSGISGPGQCNVSGHRPAAAPFAAPFAARLLHSFRRFHEPSIQPRRTSGPAHCAG